MSAQFTRSAQLRRARPFLGKEADIAVWDRDMYALPAQELRNLKCTMTLLHGELVFDSERP
ncbi:MAG TPA: hypothetical protein VII35_08370 [Steroidobacteraceae bacterium]